jgi:hypothetical protein
VGMYLEVTWGSRLQLEKHQEPRDASFGIVAAYRYPLLVLLSGYRLSLLLVFGSPLLSCSICPILCQPLSARKFFVSRVSGLLPQAHLSDPRNHIQTEPLSLVSPIRMAPASSSKLKQMSNQRRSAYPGFEPPHLSQRQKWHFT